MLIFEIRSKKREEATPAKFAQILANFASQSPIPFWKKLILGSKDHRIFLEILSFRQTIRFFIICQEYLKTYFQSQLAAQYPTTTIIPTKDFMGIFTSGSDTLAASLLLRQPAYYPLMTFRAFRDENDLLASPLGVLAQLTGEESALIQYAITPAGSSWQTGAFNLITQGITDTATGHRRRLPNERTIREKISLNGLRCGIRILTKAPTRPRASMILTDIAGSFGAYARGDGNSFGLKKPRLWSKTSLKHAVFNRTLKFVPKFQILTTEEIASLFHPPSTTLSGIKNIAWGGQMLSEAPDNLPIADSASKEKHEVNFFARTEFKNAVRTFGIKKADRRRHAYIVGKTGSGKTTLIANMAINDMRNGEGLAVIDPHGDLCDILLNYVPKRRINDVAYLNPADSSNPFRLNPLEMPAEIHATQAELVTSGIVSIFNKLYAHSWGPRLEYILRNTLLSLTAVPGSTLVDVPRMLSDAHFRRQALTKLDDHVLKSFWEKEFATMSEKLRSEAISPILNKVGQFVTSPMIRNIIGHPKSTVNLTDFMNQGKIVLINLSQGKLGEDNASLLGAMMITKMQLSAMTRVYQEEEKRRDFYLYVDEFQNFATTSFMKILSEARKYRLDLTLANQYIAQVDEPVRKAIFGNVGTLISFIVGADDARHLSFEFGKQYEPEAFVSLENYQVLLKMAIEGKTSTPFYAKTLPLPKSITNSRDKVIKVSQQRYGKKTNN